MTSDHIADIIERIGRKRGHDTKTLRTYIPAAWFHEHHLALLCGTAATASPARRHHNSHYCCTIPCGPWIHPHRQMTRRQVDWTEGRARHEDTTYCGCVASRPPSGIWPFSVVLRLRHHPHTRRYLCVLPTVRPLDPSLQGMTPSQVSL